MRQRSLRRVSSNVVSLTLTPYIEKNKKGKKGKAKDEVAQEATEQPGKEDAAVKDDL